MLQRTLSGLVFLLAFLAGAVLMVTQTDFENLPKPQAVRETGGIRERIASLPSGVLSKLSMIPSASKPKPIAVVIENHEGARPYHSGLEDALMVQEFLVEGFISRFIALFDSRNLPREIGPARSLRNYFLDGIAPWSRTVFHAGGSPDALERVQEGKEFYALNLLYFDDENKENGSLRKEGVPAPHDLFLKKKALKSLVAEVPDRLLKSVDWPPFLVGLPEGGQRTEDIRINFFSSLHNVSFEYLPLAKKYKRTNGGEVSKARPSNVLILEVPIDAIVEYGRLKMTLTGRGNALVFHSGKVWEGKWNRDHISEPFQVTDTEGEEIPFVSGQVWMTVLPTLDRISWEDVEEE